MMKTFSTAVPTKPRASLLAGVATLLLLLAPVAASAKTTMIGSPLSVPATLNTAENLSYPGTYTDVPVSPEAPNGIFHTFHFGADTALWNFSQAAGATSVPETGQASKIEVEGCAEKASNGPNPLTTVHFQDLSPTPDGGAKVNITSQGFDLPVCGENGAGASTITSFIPINLCVAAGDYVGFNDSGGYVPNVYRNGVPYQVLGSVTGATTDSFIKDEGTGNGALLAPSVTSANDGFAVNRNEELMMRVTLATGADETHICAGGTQGLPPALAPIRVSPQTDGVNHSRIVAVAVFCRVSPCNGVATLGASGAATSTYGHEEIYGRAGFALQPNKTVHLPIRVTSRLVREIRAKRGVSTTLTAVVDGKAITQRITIKIL
ncbi:MAG TPA: hypothetical protein VN889_03920 [Solirubrobacteraceae bacterium]|nr:hypothetical protein [Solirubrobacteraceae bacterium]